MYLKNMSTKTSVVINTARGKVGIRPQEVVDIRYKILPPISNALKQVEEEEYISFCEERDGIVATAAKIQREQDTEIIPVVTEDKLDDLEVINNVPKEELITEVQSEIKDKGIHNFINTLMGKDEKDDKDDKEENTALLVNETDSTDEISNLEQQIADLKEQWKATTSARKKEKFQKEIKELQKQLKKIQK